MHSILNEYSKLCAGSSLSTALLALPLSKIDLRIGVSGFRIISDTPKFPNASPLVPIRTTYLLYGLILRLRVEARHKII